MGNYFQCFKGSIYIGKGSRIAQNTGIITVNHNVHNLNLYDDGKDVILGKDCWIGMNAVILPGVVLGDKTIVGAGSVVTKSFPEGNCIIAGNPAKIIRKI
jgi:acetyltransferase-like isoleucine patch superfamily enzyme